MDPQKPTLAVNKLIELGWTEAGIAASVGSTQPTIHRIKEGGSCLYALGAALVRLAALDMPAPSGAVCAPPASEGRAPDGP